MRYRRLTLTPPDGLTAGRVFEFWRINEEL